MPPQPVRPSTTVYRIWLDIEDETPSKYYDPDTAVNQNFISELASAVESSGVPLGIYTTKTYWQNIMNNTIGYSQYPLWYPVSNILRVAHQLLF